MTYNKGAWLCACLCMWVRVCHQGYPTHIIHSFLFMLCEQVKLAQLLFALNISRIFWEFQEVSGSFCIRWQAIFTITQTWDQFNLVNSNSTSNLSIPNLSIPIFKYYFYHDEVFYILTPSTYLEYLLRKVYIPSRIIIISELKIKW